MGSALPGQAAALGDAPPVGTVRAASITSRPIGQMPDGRPVHEHRLDNGRGLVLCAIDFGAIVTRLECPDRHGRSGNVVLGFDSLADYLAPNPHFGAVAGRFANRIAGGRFVLDGREARLECNDGLHALHGGSRGLGRRCWSATPLPPQDDGGVAVEFDLVSEDGEGGYPGRLAVAVRYTVLPDAVWRIDYRATTSHPTVLNLTHHGYYNLAGGGSALGHRLTLRASHYLAVGAGLIPTDRVRVDGTPFDFREPVAVDARIRDDHPQLLAARGYDHCFVLDRDGAAGLVPAARLQDPVSGRVMDVETTEPGIQFYSGNFLDGSLVGSGHRTYRQGDGLCLETQHFPDSPNRPDFPSTVLRPGETFRSTTVHRFSVA